jgi:hypothetical protein
LNKLQTRKKIEGLLSKDIILTILLLLLDYYKLHNPEKWIALLAQIQTTKETKTINHGINQISERI